MPSLIAASEFDLIPDVIAAFRDGQFVVVLDDPSRENEADLIIAAQAVTTAQMAFMVRHGSGMVCVPVSGARADAWGLEAMVAAERSEDPRGTAYTVSVDGAHPSVSTGISARDRALVCRVLARDPARLPSRSGSDAVPDDTVPEDAGLRRPGHVFPLRAQPGGVRQRRGHTEAAIDLCRLAGFSPAAALCELVDDGDEVPGRAERLGADMLRGDAAVAFARRYSLRVCTIADLVRHIVQTEGELKNCST